MRGTTTHSVESTQYYGAIKMTKKDNIGSSLDDFLKDEGIYEDSHNIAIKRVLAYQLNLLMEQQNISKVDFAERMQTSRSSLDRLLDPDNDSVTLETLKKAAEVFNQKLEIRLVDAA